MCGRYVLTRSASQLAKTFEASVQTESKELNPNYNVAPSSQVAIIRESSRSGDEERVVSTARWGLIPRWAKNEKIGYRMINSRAETVTSSPAFRGPFARHRCLVPADGWYEWKKSKEPKGKKQPYFMTLEDDSIVAFGGIWEVWKDPEAGEDADPIISMSIVTVPAIGEFADIHDRMPLIVPKDEWVTWLGEGKEQKEAAAQAKELLNNLRGDKEHGIELAKHMEFRTIGLAVGNTRNNFPELLERVDLS